MIVQKYVPDRVRQWRPERKIYLNYIENWSLGLDMKFILETVRAVFEHEGAF